MQNERRISVRNLAVVAVIVSSLFAWSILSLLFGWFILFAYKTPREANDFPLTWSYGFPLIFMRLYYPDVVRFSRVAFVFDALLALLAVSCSGFCVHHWSASWSKKDCMSFTAASGLLILLIISSWWLEYPVGILILLMLAVGFLLFWLHSYYTASLIFGRSLLGARWDFLLPPSLLAALLLIGWGSSPNDPFFDHGPSDVPALVKYLSNENPHIRSLALSSLRGLKPYSKSTAEAILHAMSDPDEHVSSNAISLASDLGPSASEAVPILLAQFTRNGGGLFELAELGPIAKDAGPILKEKLPESEGYQKLGISKVLWKIVGETDLTVPALIELLSNDFGPIRVEAAELLGKIGPPAKEAVPILQKMVWYIPKSDVERLSSIGSENPKIRSSTEEEFYPRIRAAAQTALRLIDPPRSRLATPQ